MSYRTRISALALLCVSFAVAEVHEVSHELEGLRRRSADQAIGEHPQTSHVEIPLAPQSSDCLTCSLTPRSRDLTPGGLDVQLPPLVERSVFVVDLGLPSRLTPRVRDPRGPPLL